MNKNLFLGIDTSCYTTSLAVVDIKGKVVLNLRRILKVKKGKQGLRQSEAFFQHVSNLSEMYYLIASKIDLRRLKAISVSSQPRNLDDSYMPVFLSGLYFARNVSKSLNIKLNKFSHQEGHIMSSISSSNFCLEDNMTFYSLHLSGGTTEILECFYKNNRFLSKIIGGTLDISAGKLIDRVGVRMGMDFPCGKELEKLANSSESDEIYKISVKGTYFNLSGIESYGYKNINKIDNADNAKSLILAFSKTIEKALENLENNYDILVTGGVSSNKIFRKRLNNKFSNVFFGSVELSTDNAVGIALLGRGDLN